MRRGIPAGQYSARTLGATGIGAVAAAALGLLVWGGANPAASVQLPRAAVIAGPASTPAATPTIVGTPLPGLIQVKPSEDVVTFPPTPEAQQAHSDGSASPKATEPNQDGSQNHHGSSGG